MLVTRKANPFMPPRIVVYGPEGVGKSTLGALAEEPVFITPEGGADRLVRADGLAVDIIPNVSDWTSIMGGLVAVRDLPHNFKTLVLDSADWIEAACHKQIVTQAGEKGINSGKKLGYGAGYRESSNLHSQLFELLEQIRVKRGMKIVVTAHAHVKSVKDPEMMEDYDSFEIKCHEYVSSMWREWADGLFFVRFKTFMAKSESATGRALTDGTRVLYARKTPAFQAKNRYGMPAEMDFGMDFWDQFEPYFRAGVKPESAEEIFAECEELLKKVEAGEMKTKIEEFINNNKTDVAKLGGTRIRLKDITATKE